MENLIIILIVAAIVAAAIAYIVKEKKKGAVCVGCPFAGECAKKHSAEGGCGCSGEQETK